MKYTTVPNYITFKDIQKQINSLSASQYKNVIIPNKSYLYVRDFLTRNLTRNDLGSEIGSFNYIPKSNKYFFRTKGLQSHSYIPDITSESLIPMNPKAFLNQNLKKGDIIISKDSNIGEAIILDKDYPNIMLSSALYKLPTSNWKYYLLAFLKHNCFREQIDYIVPKSSTIRHAKTLFLDCKVTIPQKDKDNVIEYIEVLTKALIKKEIEIQKKHILINAVIENELFNNYEKENYKYEYPYFKELSQKSRIDTGLYSTTYKEIDFILKNYKNGYYNILAENISSGSTPKVRYISKYLSNLKYTWITPTGINDLGIIDLSDRLNMKGINNIKKNSMLIINRTSKGGIGEYVGISSFYDVNLFGEGHHNQGIYRVINYSDEKLIFMTCLINSKLYRKYSACASVGSKMKEIKISHFLQFPFPNFPNDLIKQIVKLYRNENLFFGSNNLNITNYEEKDNIFNNDAGIMQLAYSANKIKVRLDEVIDQIINNQKVEISFNL